MSTFTSPDPSRPEANELPRLIIGDRDGVAYACFPRQKVDGIAVRELYEAAMVLTGHPHPRLMVDLTGLAMVTSGLMGILVQVHKRFLQAGGRVVVAVPDARVRGAFEIANLHQLLHLYAELDEARRGLMA